MRVTSGPSPEIDVMAMDYRKEYLASALWRRIKRRVLKRDNKTCLHCGGDANVVHHRSYAREVLEGTADEMLASLCDGCHNFVHFDDDGRARALTDVDLVLLARSPATEIPEPVVNLRLARPRYPSNWLRMSAVQRSQWHGRYRELSTAKRKALNAKKEAAQHRAQSRVIAPLGAGLIRLSDVVVLWKREPGGTFDRTYEWFRESAERSGKVHIGRTEIVAVKIGREWAVAGKDLKAAFANQRKHEAHLDRMTADYGRGVYHGKEGQRVDIRGGWYMRRGSFRFVWSAYGHHRRKSEGGWFCNCCDRPAKESGTQPTCGNCGVTY